MSAIASIARERKKSYSPGANEAKMMVSAGDGDLKGIILTRKTFYNSTYLCTRGYVEMSYVGQSATSPRH